MVKIMENPIKMDDLGGKPTIFGNIHMGVSGKMVGFPNQPMGFPTKNDQHLGWRLGKPTI